MKATNPRLTKEESACLEVIALRLKYIETNCNLDAKELEKFVTIGIKPYVHAVMTAPHLRTESDQDVLRSAAREYWSLKACLDTVRQHEATYPADLKIS